VPGDPIAFLLGLERLGMKFGLENISRLCAALDHPERAFTSIIVAGTNGKGSVTAMLNAALTAAGHRAARYTSPHLERLEERFVVGGREVTHEALADAAGRVQRAVEALLSRGEIEAPPTFFECTTAAAFELFRSAGVRVAVLEVGLGGRLDATNVVTPIAAAITSIALDHQAQLGSTLASVAREKAGVIKPGIPVVCGGLPPEADDVIAEVCRREHARLVRAAEAVACTWRTTGGGTTVAGFRTSERQLREVRLALAGGHQVENAAITVALADEVSRLGVAVDDRSLTRGLSDVEWPARLERRRYGATDVLLDAAHNPAGARTLAAYLETIGWWEAALVFGAMADKDVAGMLTELLPLRLHLSCTTAPGGRAMPALDIARLAAGLGWPAARIDTVPDPATAFGRACASAPRVIVAGSIFLIGALRGILATAPPDA
jgi:dihydrofolate synthase/folylpolyglutamate synthase